MESRSEHTGSSISYTRGRIRSNYSNDPGRFGINLRSNWQISTRSSESRQTLGQSVRAIRNHGRIVIAKAVSNLEVSIFFRAQ
jgi:hypothetical protein